MKKIFAFGFLLLFLSSCEDGFNLPPSDPEEQELIITQEGNIVKMSWSKTGKSVIINRLNPIGYPIPSDTITKFNDVTIYYESTSVNNGSKSIPKYSGTKLIIINKPIYYWQDTLTETGKYRYQISTASSLDGFDRGSFTDLIDVFKY